MGMAPYLTVEAAWFQTMRDVQRQPANPPGRSAEVLRCLDTLYRRRRIELLHARILRLYGQRGRAPDPRRAQERCDWRLWREAMDGLEPMLRRAGLIPPGFQAPLTGRDGPDAAVPAAEALEPV